MQYTRTRKLVVVLVIFDAVADHPVHHFDLRPDIVVVGPNIAIVVVVAADIIVLLAEDFLYN